MPKAEPCVLCGSAFCTYITAKLRLDRCVHTHQLLVSDHPSSGPLARMKRTELDAIARERGIDTTELPNKPAVIAAIETA